MKKARKKIQDRPAESGSLAAATVALIGYFAGVKDPGVLIALTVFVGGVPGAISWLVDKFDL